MADDLFQPTIEAHVAPAKSPWRPTSIVYPAFFGGPLAGMVLGLLNGRKLGLGWRSMTTITVAGVAAIVGRFLLTPALSNQTGTRVIGALAGAAVWGVIALLQKTPYRVYELRGGEPANLVGPGLAAAIGCGLIEGVALFILLR